MATKISYKGPMDAEPKLVGYFRESPKAALQGLFSNHRIYKYNGVLNPIDNTIESRCSGLVISNADVPKGSDLLSINDVWFESSFRPELTDEIYYDAAREAIETNLILFIGKNQINYLELMDWQQNEAKERVVEDLLDIVSATLKIKDPTPDHLRFILEQ